MIFYTSIYTTTLDAQPIAEQLQLGRMVAKTGGVDAPVDTSNRCTITPGHEMLSSGLSAAG